MATLSQFRDKFPQFSEVSDAAVQDSLDDAAEMMCETKWGDRYDTGQLFLAAHYVALSTGSVGGGGGSVGPMSQATTGPLSVSMTTHQAGSSSEAMIGSTYYGQRYQQIRDVISMCGVVV